MRLQDDRTPDDMTTPHVLAIFTDRCLSGWGGAEGGPSFAAWPVRPEDAERVADRLRTRGDAMRVRIVLSSYRPPTGPGHCHIYAGIRTPDDFRAY